MFLFLAVADTSGSKTSDVIYCKFHSFWKEAVFGLATPLLYERCSFKI